MSCLEADGFLNVSQHQYRYINRSIHWKKSVLLFCRHCSQLRCLACLGDHTRPERARKIRKDQLTTERRSRTSRPSTKTYDLGWKAKDIPANDVNEDAYAFNRWDRKDASTHWTAPHDEGRRLYVGGLPRISGQDIVNAEMRQLFSNWHVEAVSKIILPHEDSVRWVVQGTVRPAKTTGEGTQGAVGWCVAGAEAWVTEERP